MLRLHYVGPKVLISQHGIFFKKGKPDKYIYLHAAVYLLLTIDRHRQNRYSRAPSETLSDQEILEVLQAYEPHLDSHVQEEERRYEAHLERVREQVRSHPLSEEERRAWLNNIEIMRPYLIQREINKLYYIHCIKAIQKIIHQEEYREIDINFSLNHWHILTSIAGNLEYGVKSVRTEITLAINKEGILIARLLINPPSRDSSGQAR